MSIWLFIAGWLEQRLCKSLNKTHLLPLAFVISSIVQFNISYLLILNASAPKLTSNVLLSLASVLMTISLLTPSWRHALQSLFIRFLFPAHLLVSKQNPGAEKKLRNLRFFLVGISILLMLITQALTPTVLNWDSNWYNLSRLPAMVITRSVFPETSPVPWHVIHPITHDLLYLLDITLLNLRGMGLISMLEYIVTLGCLYQIVFFILPRPLSGNGGVKEQLALLLVTILFISSDLQVLQTTVPKNDLAILMAFVISLTLSLNHQLRRCSPAQYLFSILIVSAYSIFSKSYGIIVLTPPVIASFIDITVYIYSSSHQHIIKASKFYLRNLLADFSTLWKCNRYILLATTLIACFALYTYMIHDFSISNSVNYNKITAIVSEHTNLKGTISDQLINFFLNSVRNATSFLLYPYTTLTKINPTGPDDYLLGFGPLNHIINDPRGVMNASSIVRNIKADAAYGSIILVPLMLIIFSLYCIKCIKIPAQLHTNFAIIILSCLISFLLLSFVLLGQSFGSKFMASSYIPLIPLLSAAVVHVVSFKIRRPMFFIVSLSLFSLLRVAYLLDVSIIPTFFNQLVTSPSSLSISQSPNLFYYQYAGSRYSPSQADRWLTELANLPSGNTHFLCYDNETPTLTPFMYAIQSFNRDSHLDLRLSSKNDCEILQQQMATATKSSYFIDLF